MMELARRFAGRGTPPRRRMVFIAFCAEESGRIGSRHYASKEPLFPIKDTVAMINFDMIGRLRGEELGVAGDESAAEFKALLAGADDRSALGLRLGGPEYPDDSDHASFADVGVPILYLCTGATDDRHTPADTADKINYEGMAKVVDFCEDMLDRLSAMPRPRFVPPPGRVPPKGSE
jgi:Zn-dependent M28 family amino/carboxypeptidase